MNGEKHLTTRLREPVELGIVFQTCCNVKTKAMTDTRVSSSASHQLITRRRFADFHCLPPRLYANNRFVEIDRCCLLFWTGAYG